MPLIPWFPFTATFNTTYYLIILIVVPCVVIDRFFIPYINISLFYLLLHPFAAPDLPAVGTAQLERHAPPLGCQDATHGGLLGTQRCGRFRMCGKHIAHFIALYPLLHYVSFLKQRRKNI